MSDVHWVLALAREVASARNAAHVQLDAHLSPTEPQHTSNLTQTKHPPPSTTCSDCWQRSGYVQKQRTHRPSAVPLASSGTVT
jgi:cytochrome c553